jgi:hypothetical protein
MQRSLAALRMTSLKKMTSLKDNEIYGDAIQSWYQFSGLTLKHQVRS